MNFVEIDEDASTSLLLPIILWKQKLRFSSTIRIMNKRGNVNVHSRNIPKKYINFTSDLANTVVSFRWRWVSLLIFLVNACFYLTFSGIFAFDAWLSDDWNLNKTSGFCISNTKHFTGYLLLSIETITTTGYGYLYPSENCYVIYFTLLLSTIVMIFLDGALISVLFVKICQPSKNDASIFSKKVTICMRNGKLCLMFRIYDYLNKHVVNPQVKVFLVQHQETGDKVEDVEFELCEVKTEKVGLLIYPTEVIHEIDSRSPFWTLSATDVMNSRFEIFVVVSGSSIITSQFSSSQTSYSEEDILWGHRFATCMYFNSKLQQYIVNKFNLFNTYPCDTPLCSASKLKEIKVNIK